MLPVTHGPQFTRLHILLYTLLLVATTILPTLIGMSGLFYLAGALVLGGYFLWLSWQLYKEYSEPLAKKTFKYSINYLALLFAVLLIDHYLW
jgi:protoheme IX farnesyltransferase